MKSETSELRARNFGDILGDTFRIYGRRGALSRSSALVKGNWWRVLGIVLVLGIMAGIISGILGIIRIVGSAIGAILSMPITIVGATLLYYDLRLKKEGYNLGVMAGEIGTSPGESVV